MYIPVNYGRNIPLIRKNAAVCHISFKSLFVYKHNF